MCMRLRLLALSLGLIALLAPVSRAQSNADRISRIKDNLNNANQAFQQLPDDVKKTAHPQRRMAQLSGVVNRMAPGLARLSQGQGASGGWQPSPGWDEGEADENGLVQVNSPARDLRFTPFAGFTQNNSATARCGDNVVVAFNDSGSILETLLTGQGGVSFGTVASGTGGISAIGYATSHNGGESFKDRGAVNPGPDVDTILLGQPSVACSDPDHFYLVQAAAVSSGVAGTFNAGHFSPVLAIVLSKSIDSGATWSDPVTLVAPDTSTTLAFQEFFQDPWIAVDPSNSKRIYISYTHQNNLRVPGCTLPPTSTVEVITSVDGGQTFNTGSPLLLDSECFRTGFIDTGTRMAISSKGRVTVAWETSDLLLGLFQHSIAVASFAPGGLATPPVVVDMVSQGGSEILHLASDFGNFIEEGEEMIGIFALQGGFENQHGFDLAVDRSGGPTDGNVYVAWDDSRNGFSAATELEDSLGFYSFTDILFSISTDGGQTFTPTRQLNSDLQPTTTREHDHFRPVLAVDRRGKVAACWYDRRNDPQNYQFERFCAESTDAGASWAEFLVPGSLSNPVTQQDLLLLGTGMGQNDNLTTDFSGHAPGFLGGIQWTSSGMNPDIKFVKFR